MEEKSRFRQKPETPVEQEWRDKRKTMYEQLERKEHIKVPQGNEGQSKEEGAIDA